MNVCTYSSFDFLMALMSAMFQILRWQGAAPGVEQREYVGADRIRPEHVRCDHGSMTFQATRVFANVAAAAAYALVGHRSEPVEGALKYGATTIYPNACVTSRRIGMVGCTVVVNYTIEG